jgi:type I restriction enzyme S subunit
MNDTSVLFSYKFSKLWCPFFSTYLMCEKKFPLVTLDSVCLKITDGSHFSPKSQSSGYPIVNVKDLRSGYIDINSCTKINISDFLLLKASGCTCTSGDVLFSKDGTVGKVVPVRGEEKLAALSSICLITPREQLDQNFLCHTLLSQSVCVQTANLMSGSAIKRLVLRDIKKIEIPLPQKSEQRFIATILDTMDEAIRRTEAVIAKLRQVKAGMLHDLLTRGLDENGELRDPLRHPEQFKDSPFGRIPKEWTFVPLGKKAEITSGITLGNTPRGTGTIELPYLRVANVQDGYLDLQDMKKIRIYKKDINRFALRRGDVLMNEGGDYDKLGRGAIWEGQIEPCLHQNHVFRVRPFTESLNSYFLDAVSGSHYGKGYFLLSSKQSTNLASINSTQLKNFPIPCPDINEQLAIVAAIAAFDVRFGNENEKSRKLETIKQGIMHDLLIGRVRVPSHLLEAIL